MDLLKVSSSPHVRTSKSTSQIMFDVVIALMPASAASIYFFGLSSLLTIAVSVISAVLAEHIVCVIRKRETTITDYSAVVTGIILALNLPSGTPVWIPAIGSIFAIVIAKQLFGGIGENFINPAMAGRVFLVISYPKIMTTFVEPFTDAVSSATPLRQLSMGSFSELPDITNTLFGSVSGCIGETSAIAILIGAVYLVMRKVISPLVPALYAASIFVLTMIFHSFDLYFSTYAVISGGVLLGGVFMLTDYSSSPISKKGKIIFALGAGIITFVIREFGAYTEGVMFSVLLMNIAMPLIENYSSPRVFGTGRKQ